MTDGDKPRTLRFYNEDQLISEVSRLRKGHRKLKNWTLPQAAWHLSAPIKRHLKPPVTNTPTAEEAEKKAGFVDKLLTTRKSPEGREAPPPYIPPETCDECEIDSFIEALKELKAYPHPMVAMGPVGPVTIDEYRQCILIHAEHHLGFFLPTLVLREIKYGSPDEVIADVHRLRKGYVQNGNWSLPQIARHLSIAMERTMRVPSDPHTPEQLAMAGAKANAFSTGKLPEGLQTSEQMIPPMDCDEADVEKLIGHLTALKGYTETGSHRLFGPLTNVELKTFSMLHCQRHLRNLTPNF